MRLSHVLRFAYIFFFFNDTATTEIYTLSLHDALPILVNPTAKVAQVFRDAMVILRLFANFSFAATEMRSEEHTSELQSLTNLVCRLLLEKKKKTMEKRVTTIL